MALELSHVNHCQEHLDFRWMEKWLYKTQRKKEAKARMGMDGNAPCPSQQEVSSTQGLLPTDMWMRFTKGKEKWDLFIK